VGHNVKRAPRDLVWGAGGHQLETACGHRLPRIARCRRRPDGIGPEVSLKAASMAAVNGNRRALLVG